MKIKFTKMHGAGNDFIVIDGIGQEVELTPEQCRHLADRRFGIGADQILLVQQPSLAGVDFSYRIFNADGCEVEQCGNGARAFARFVTDHRLTSKKTIAVATMSGIISLTVHDDGNVSVDMGAPLFTIEQVPFDAGGLMPSQQGDDTCWPVQVNDQVRLISVLSMGNPHAVQLVDSVDRADVENEGPALERHARFPNRVNAGFLEIVDVQYARLRVHERGAGETLACGTGACAAVVTGIRRGLLVSPVTVEMRGGQLRIEWRGGDSTVILSGPAVAVFEGEVSL